MRFEIFALPVLAAIAEAAAISSKSSSVCTTCPVTIQNTDAAIASVMSQMSAQSPKAALTTKTVTGSPVASTAVAKMSITKAATSSVKPASSVKLTSSAKPTSSAKSTASAKSISSAKPPSSTSKTTPSSSSKKRQRRAATASATTTTAAACATQPNYGYTYTPADPSPSSFLKDLTLRTQYMSANSPQNYTWRFAGFYASQSQPGYLFYTELSSYNPTLCAGMCDNNANCKGFNIYFERSPKVAPGEGCANPAPQVNVKCAFYSAGVSEADAVNVGSWRASFNVVITGANGYTKN